MSLAITESLKSNLCSTNVLDRGKSKGESKIFYVKEKSKINSRKNKMDFNLFDLEGV